MHYINQVLKCACVYEKEHLSFSCEIVSLKNYLLEHLNSGTNWLFMWKIIWEPDFYFKIITKSHTKSSKTHSIRASWTLGLHQTVFLSVTLKCAFPTTVIIIIKASYRSAICTVSLNTDLSSLK